MHDETDRERKRESHERRDVQYRDVEARARIIQVIARQLHYLINLKGRCSRTLAFVAICRGVISIVIVQHARNCRHPRSNDHLCFAENSNRRDQKFPFRSIHVSFVGSFVSNLASLLFSIFVSLHWQRVC